jgi:hypothetical protein
MFWHQDPIEVRIGKTIGCVILVALFAMFSWAYIGHFGF